MNSEQELQKQIKTAPQRIKNLLMGDSWSKTIDRISKKQNFSLEQKTALENEVLFILLGMELASSFEKSIQTSLGISTDIALEIHLEIRDSIFSQVEEFLPFDIESESKLPEIATDLRPMIEEGEVAHDVPLPEKRDESPQVIPVPAPTTAPAQEPASEPPTPSVAPTETSEKSEVRTPTAYPPGQDPYREPIE